MTFHVCTNHNANLTRPICLDISVSLYSVPIHVKCYCKIIYFLIFLIYSHTLTLTHTLCPGTILKLLSLNSSCQLVTETVHRSLVFFTLFATFNVIHHGIHLQHLSTVNQLGGSRLLELYSYPRIQSQRVTSNGFFSCTCPLILEFGPFIYDSHTSSITQGYP